MNDLRTEDAEQQTPYAGLNEERATFTEPDIAQLREIVLWLSKQPWPQTEEQTWDGLVEAHRKASHPDPLPELPNRGFRVGK